MGLHEGRAGDRRLSVNPMLSDADPLGAMDVAPPMHRLPDGPMIPHMAYQMIHDELMLDGNSRLNLATFVTTWMEPQAAVLMAECADKNMIDKDEYPRRRNSSAAASRSWPICGTRPTRRPPWAARRPGRARRACWPGSRSSGAG